MEIEYYEYEGNPIMKIVTGESKDGKKTYGISFGKKKAQAILEHIDEIRKFVGGDDCSVDNPPF